MQAAQEPSTWAAYAYRWAAFMAWCAPITCLFQCKQQKLLPCTVCAAVLLGKT